MKQNYFIIIILLLLVTLHGKAQWTKINETFDGGIVTAIKLFGNKLFVATANNYPKHNKIYESNDGGQTWILRKTMNGHNDAYIQFASLGNILFVADADSGIYKSSDSGITWHQIFYLTSVHHYPITVFNSIIIVGTDYGKIYRSLDCGITWTFASNTPCNYVNRVASNSTNIFVGHCGGIYTSTDGGVNWYSINNGLVGTDIGLFGVTDSNVFTSDATRVYVTSNNGINWTNTTNNLYINATKWCFGISNSNLLLSDQKGVFLTKNKGQSWMFANFGISVNRVYAFGTFNNYIFATTEVGIFRIDTSALNSIPCDHLPCIGHSTPTCQTCSDGTATVQIIGGTPPYTFSWNTIPIQTTQTAIGLSSGYYSYCLTDARGCNNCDSVMVFYTSGINSIYDESTILVSPNPFCEKVNVISYDNQTKEIILYNLVLREIIRKTFTTSITLNTDHLSDGIYIYDVKNKDKILMKGKVVKLSKK